MLLTLFAFLMKYVDISKLHSERCSCGGSDSADACQHNINNNNNNHNNNNNKAKCWQHAAQRQFALNAHNNNGSSSSSSGAASNSSSYDSNASSTKENHYLADHLDPQQHRITPQQLQQIRYYQQLQQQQLQLLQQQLLQRRRLQQHLREQGVEVGVPRKSNATSGATLTCNQQYLMQQRLEQQQQQQQLRPRNVDNSMYNKNNNSNIAEDDILNNNDVCAFGGNDGCQKGQIFRRGMTEFSTNNDINNKSHLSQPLQNSPRHYHHHHQTKSVATQPHPNSPQHYANINKHQQQLQHFTHHALSKQTHNNKNNQQTLPLNSSANIINNSKNISNNSATSPTKIAAYATSPTSAAHSPLHYKNPLNSPNNSPFTYAYYGSDQSKHHNKAAGTQQQQQHHQLQQHLRGHKLPLLSQAHAPSPYQQHLNDLLLQQQHLQKHQQQLLSAKDADDELSEESLKQNVAIVLNNLDRYNNALHSIILNEQVSSNSSLFIDDSLLVGSGANNNFLLSTTNSNCNGSTMAAMAAASATPESDYNSNATTPGSRHNMPLDSNMLQQQQQHLVGFANAVAAAAALTCTAGAGGGGGVSNNGLNGGGGFLSNNLNNSIASSHDFTHDNSDYQWLLDCDYRDGGGLQRSIFSSISASCNGDLIFYNDFSKKLDANLAEVDMESFRAEDILLHMPSYCKGMNDSSRLQQSLLHNMMPSLTAQQAQMLSQTSLTSNNELIDNSICKSELLFSPVRESHLSEDSLDMDAYPENEDIILTCKANKDNYTIAFEGSELYSDESFYVEPTEIATRNKQNCINLHSNLEDIVQRKSLDVSMSRSEQAFTARNKLQKSHTIQLQRYPSGNNNTADIIIPIFHAPCCTVRKSRSVPNLREPVAGNACSNGAVSSPTHAKQPLNVSQAVTTSTMDCCKALNLLPMCQMPISCNSTNGSFMERLPPNQSQQHQHLQDQPQHVHQHRHKHRYCCPSVATEHGGVKNHNQHYNCCVSATQQKHAPISGSASSGSSNPPAFNLVKLFIKQKSNNSADEQMSAHTCMDVSSGCWPSSDAAGSSSSSSLEQHLRKKSMNDSGKGSALSRHDEEEQNDEMVFRTERNAGHPTPTRRAMRMRVDAVFNDEDPSSSSTSGSLTATNSPAHRRRSMPLRNPQLCQLATQHKSTGTTCSLQSSDGSHSNSEQLTQVYVSSGTASAGTTTKQSRRGGEGNRTASAASSSEMITRSMQTSCGSLSTRSSMSDRFRFVPPSFLAKLNNLGEERQAPIYVIYPNYALPDLGFVKTHSSAEVIFSPFNYKMTVGGATSTSFSALKNRLSLTGNEDEILKTMDYKHIMDWQSLATLLPADYRRRLKHIPEVSRILPGLEAELSQRPLFCMSPPIRRNRPHICECAQYFQQQQQQNTQVPTGEEGSSSSASSQQPSSGYRGSSTLLADSGELENADPLKQMYVYQYEQQRMDSGVEMSPAASKTPPQPMPRGILRKSSSANRNKRNSMIEEHHTKLTKQEKRRSLQEPPYHHAVGSSEELGEVFEEESDLYAVPQPRKERLSRKDLDARARAENFLSSLPRNELKYYAEIAAILESSTEHQVDYDPAALKKEVSRALSQQKKVSFNDMDEQNEQSGAQVQQLLPPEARQRFSTPPNSPNISMAAGGLRLNEPVTRRCSQAEQHAKSEDRKRLAALDEKEKRKIESNRFKRLQIQWELLSKDSSMLKELANEDHTKSGGSTPTAAAGAEGMTTAAHKSRIPRPVSYPAGKISAQETSGKATTRSPSRIVPPKRYSMISTPGTTAAVTSPSSATAAGAVRARTPTSRVAVTAPNTPKRRVQSPRTIPRVR